MAGGSQLQRIFFAGLQWSRQVYPAQAYARALADFERLQSPGKLKHLPVREFSLDQIAQAHEAVEKGNNATRMVIVMT